MLLLRILLVVGVAAQALEKKKVDKMVPE